MKVPAVESPGGTAYMVLGLIFGESAIRDFPRPELQLDDFLSRLVLDP